MINEDVNNNKDNNDNNKYDKYLKILEKLRPIDDNFMRAMFKDNIPLGQFVLRIILNKKDLILTKLETQYDGKRVTGARSLCLDVYACDKDNKKYDLEIQREDKGASPKRARYHSSVVDIENLNVNDEFDDLIGTSIIFICENDIYGKGEPIYSFNRVDTCNGIIFNDECNILYVNGKYRQDDDLGRLMHDFNCNKADDMYYDIMKETTRYLKETKEGVQQMCKILEEFVEEENAKVEARFASLMQRLFSLDRIEDAKRASVDSKYREQLLKEFSLV